MMGLHIQPVNPYYYHYHKTSCNPYYFYTYSFFTLLAYMTANICPESFSTFFTSSASCFSSASSFLLASADPESVAESFAPLKERPTDRLYTHTQFKFILTSAPPHLFAASRALCSPGWRDMPLEFPPSQSRKMWTSLHAHITYIHFRRQRCTDKGDRNRPLVAWLRPTLNESKVLSSLDAVSKYA